jgi:hypothetical protein
LAVRPVLEPELEPAAEPPLEPLDRPTAEPPLREDPDEAPDRRTAVRPVEIEPPPLALPLLVRVYPWPRTALPVPL